MNQLVFALLAQTLIHVYTSCVEQKSVEFIDTHIGTMVEE